MELLLNALGTMLLPSFSQRRRENQSSRVTESRETVGARRPQIDNVPGRREDAFPPPLWAERRALRELTSVPYVKPWLTFLHDVILSTGQETIYIKQPKV